MKRLPLLPTLFVALAVPTMIGFGVWQLDRAEWKAALLARLEANRSLPAIDLPASLDAVDSLAFRRARVVCSSLEPTTETAARTVDGRLGFRRAALCRRAAGDAVVISTGVFVGARPTDAGPMPTAFAGPLVPRAGDPPFVLIAENAVPGLNAEAPPTTDTIPNNHLAYAGQWFFFALTLAVIYGLYLRKRRAR